MSVAYQRVSWTEYWLVNRRNGRVRAKYDNCLEALRAKANNPRLRVRSVHFRREIARNAAAARWGK